MYVSHSLSVTLSNREWKRSSEKKIDTQGESERARPASLLLTPFVTKTFSIISQYPDFQCVQLSTSHSPLVSERKGKTKEHDKTKRKRGRQREWDDERHREREEAIRIRSGSISFFDFLFLSLSLALYAFLSLWLSISFLKLCLSYSQLKFSIPELLRFSSALQNVLLRKYLFAFFFCLHNVSMSLFNTRLFKLLPKKLFVDL